MLLSVPALLWTVQLSVEAHTGAGCCAQQCKIHEGRGRYREEQLDFVASDAATPVGSVVVPDVVHMFYSKTV